MGSTMRRFSIQFAGFSMTSALVDFNDSDAFFQIS